MPVRLPTGPRHMYGRAMFPQDGVPILCRKYRHGDHYAHDHDFVEIATVLSGRGRHVSMYGEQDLEPGAVFILRPGAWHGYKSPSSFLLYNLCVGLELFQRELSWLREDPRLGYLLWAGPMASNGPRVMGLRLPGEALERCDALLDRLREAVAEGEQMGRAACVGRLLEYLDELGKNLGPVHRPKAEQAVLPHRLVAEGTHLLERDVSHCWTLTELAERLGADESYVARLFKRSTGLPPMAYLNRARVERAAVLLLSTTEPIANVGQMVGWDDANYFARRFKAHLGVTASEYRAKYAGLRRP